MARPRIIHIPADRLEYLCAQGYGARRVARVLGCSVSTARRALRALREFGSKPDTSVGTAAGASVGGAAGAVPASKPAGSEPRSGTASGSGKRTTRWVLSGFAGPGHVPGHADGGCRVRDAAWARAEDELGEFRGALAPVEFDAVVGRLAGELRRVPARDGVRAALAASAAADEARDLVARRRAWMRSAENDLERRWDEEVRGIVAEVEAEAAAGLAPGDVRPRRIAGPLRDRMLALLARRLAAHPTDDNYFDIVDRQIADGARRLRRALTQLVKDEEP